MIDPVQSLAFSMQSNPGVYALLLGSGVSRSAQVPTGWDIVLDLLGKLAAAAGEKPGIDLGQWYRDEYGEPPEYSKLLESLANTPTERQQLLRQYFEPTDEEREEGLKQPTVAHRAIAWLVSKKYIKVIVTTNFDRLLEDALNDLGVVPRVLSTLDQVKGAIPLTHAEPWVIKVNGDYQDTCIRNSASELTHYPDEFNSLLDNVFDEYGLIVCGWSAVWDVGLRKAMCRSRRRRFTTYWALHREAADEAKRLMLHCGASEVRIEDADTFFDSLQQTVESIEDYSARHPLSVEVAVASFKRHLVRPEHRIRLVDLVDSTVARAAIETSGDGFQVQNMPEPTAENISVLLRTYESAYSTLLSMAPLGGHWAEDEHRHLWARALERLTINQDVSGNTVLISLKTYPAILLLYALGLGALASDRLEFLSQMLGVRISVGDMDGQTVSILPALFGSMKLPMSLSGMALDDQASPRLALNQAVVLSTQGAIATGSRQLINNTHYFLIEWRFSLLLAFRRYYEGKHYWAPLGLYVFRRANRIRILGEIHESLTSRGEFSPFIRIRDSWCGFVPQRFRSLKN